MSPAAPLPAELLARELRGPRYTSYPTALSFGPQFGETDYVGAARDSALERAPLSLYVHIPFCASNCWYCGCHRVISRNPARMDRYVAALRNEIGLQAALLDPTQEVVQLHFGGGTPNNLGNDQLEELVRALRAQFRFAAPARLEQSMEVDPRLAEPADLAVWKALGFNRLSFGIQDVSDAVQRAINRIQSRGHIAALVQAARAAGFTSLNFDLVYGLPLQTSENFAQTLDFVLEQRPERLAAYHYAHMPERLPAQRAIDAALLPSDQQRQRLRRDIHERLTAVGYVAIGLDHYALPGDPLARAHAEGTLHRNFQGYSTLAGCDMLGLGVSSISKLGRCYAQNLTDLERYEQAVEQQRLPLWRGYRLTRDDRLRAEIIESIMCCGAVDFAPLEQRYELRAGLYFADELERLAELDPQGEWLRHGDWGLRVDERGRDLLRVVAMVFDAHLQALQAQARFSRIA